MPRAAASPACSRAPARSSASSNNHPDTGGRLEGLTIPDWPALTALALKAAAALPGLRMQAWDIAPTDRGPVLVEVNIGGDFNLPQLAHRTGLMDDRFRTFLAACASSSP